MIFLVAAEVRAPWRREPQILGGYRLRFATSVQRGLRRTLEEVTGAVENAEAGPTVEERGALHAEACT